jgi:zinc protease
VPSELQLPVIHQGEIDGVPTLWSPMAGPLTAALQFRVGRVDEQRPISGITHLVEHLAFTGLLDQEYELSGFVEPTRTVFHATGHPHEVAAFLARICDNLSDLPLDRLAHERRVLVQEASERPTSVDGQMRWFRYGPQGHGLADGPEFGLDWLGPDPIDAWRRQSFTRDNAMLVLSGEPPTDLRLALPAGSRKVPVVPVPDPDLPLPAFVRWDQDAVCLTLVGERNPELTMVLGILERRLKRTLRHEQGSVYDLSAIYSPLTGTFGHVFLATECASDQVVAVQDAILQAVEALATDGPTGEEVGREIDSFERLFMDPSIVFGLMDTQAQDMLLGQPIMLPDEGVARRRSATPGSVRDVAAAIRASALLASSATDAPAGFQPAPLVSRAAIRGREVAPAGFHLPGRGPRERLIVGDEGVTLRFADGSISTVRYDRAVLCEHGSPTLRRLTGHDGFSVVVDADHWKDGPAIVAEIDRRVDPLLVACADDADNAGWARRIAEL